jgi:hypothetical protein
MLLFRGFGAFSRKDFACLSSKRLRSIAAELQSVSRGSMQNNLERWRAEEGLRL